MKRFYALALLFFGLSLFLVPTAGAEQFPYSIVGLEISAEAGQDTGFAAMNDARSGTNHLYKAVGFQVANVTHWPAMIPALAPIPNPAPTAHDQRYSATCALQMQKGANSPFGGGRPPITG